MNICSGFLSLAVAAVVLLCASGAHADDSFSDPCSLQWKSYSAAQSYTPEQAEREHAWKACIVTSRNEWAASLKPLPNGGWTFLMVSEDGKLAVFGSHRHATREGNIATLWLRYENRQTQNESGEYYMSKVEREMYDCARMASKVGGNNLDAIGNSFTFDEAKERWVPVIPGTIGDALLDWVCKTTPRAQSTKPQQNPGGGWGRRAAELPAAGLPIAARIFRVSAVAPPSASGSTPPIA